MPPSCSSGYATAAVISGFPLARQFGLARGFDRYDDALPAGTAERDAAEATDRALALLDAAVDAPRFLWVHYFDPHDPYAPPEPFASRYASDPYLGEVAYMDRELGRLLDAFRDRYAGNHRILIAGDHGEGLGEHGEQHHGNLLYQGTMRVPLLIAGSGLAPAVRTEPVSTRRVHDTLLAWAGLAQPSLSSLLDALPETVVGEAMKPFLQYGWQPQVMAVAGRFKAIRSGDLELYDVIADPAEGENLAATVQLDRALRQALRDYPFEPPAVSSPEAEATLSQEDRERLASLGYASWSGRQSVRKEAPSPRDMSHLFTALDAGSARFVAGDYSAAIAGFEAVQRLDPSNLMVAVRLAVAHSLLGHERAARDQFARARTIAPQSADVRHYLGQHELRSGRLDEAAALFESVLAAEPDRLANLEALGLVRARQGRLGEARPLLETVVARKQAPRAALLSLGDVAMAMGDTVAATRAFERARELHAAAFPRHLELGVLYLAARRLEDARDSLDQVAADHPGRAMALFKRAQVSVLLAEPDRQARIEAARAHADAVTSPLIAREPLFRGSGSR